MAQRSGQKKDRSGKNSDPNLAAPLPRNLSAEKAVLGAILLDNSCTPAVFSTLTGEEFFLDQHKKVFRAMQSLVGESEPVDLISLINFLHRQGNLVDAGGAAYVSSLADGLPKVTNVRYYTKIIRETHVLRNLIHMTQDIQEKAFESESSAEKIVEEAIQKLLGLRSSGEGPLVRKWYDVAQSAVEYIENERANPDQSARIFSGLTDLDDITSGLRKKEFVVIVGPTGNGKTLLAQQYAVRGSEQGYRGIIFSAEMTGEQLALRSLASEANVQFWKLRRPEHLTDVDVENLRDKASQLRPITIVEKDISPANIWAISESQKRTNGLDFVVVDYDQLVIETGIDPEDEDTFFMHQRNFILEAKRMMDRLDICFILLSQLRKTSHRVAQGGRPTLDDIYGDSAIRNTPNVIIWVVRDFLVQGKKYMSKELENKATLYIVKARNDRVGTVELYFDHVYVHLEDKHPDENDSVEERGGT